MLEKAGVLVYNDPLNITTHSKLIIIDNYITVIGSTNWSYSALMKNNESSVIISSSEVAEHYEEYFDMIRDNQE